MSKSEKNYVAMVTLRFGNGQVFIQKGKRCHEDDYLFVKAMAVGGLKLKFDCEELGEITLSTDKDDVGYFGRLFKVIKNKAN